MKEDSLCKILLRVLSLGEGLHIFSFSVCLRPSVLILHEIICATEPKMCECNIVLKCYIPGLPNIPRDPYKTHSRTVAKPPVKNASTQIPHKSHKPVSEWLLHRYRYWYDGMSLKLYHLVYLSVETLYTQCIQYHFINVLLQ